MEPLVWHKVGPADIVERLNALSSHVSSLYDRAADSDDTFCELEDRVYALETKSGGCGGGCKTDAPEKLTVDEATTIALRPLLTMLENPVTDAATKLEASRIVLEFLRP